MLQNVVSDQSVQFATQSFDTSTGSKMDLLKISDKFGKKRVSQDLG